MAGSGEHGQGLVCVAQGWLVCILVFVDACDTAMPQCIGELLVLEASFCCHDVYAL